MSYKVQQRHVLVFMIFFAIVAGLMQRNVLYMSITRMVNLPNANADEIPSDQAICTAPSWSVQLNKTIDMCDDIKEITPRHASDVRYDWSQEEQGMILSSFFIGYVITHIPGGVLAQKYGGKYVLGLGILLSAGFSMLIPLAVQIGGSTALIVIRILMGLAQGPMFPALTQILSMWVPPAERGFLMSIVYSGVGGGLAATSYFSGIILHNFGWNFTFYTFGLVAIVWFALFVFISRDNPAAHPWISREEKEYLLKELGQLERDKDQPPTPWKAMLTSKPMIVLIVALMCSDWGLYVYTSTFPKYMNDVLRFSITDIGTLNAVISILATILAYLFGYTVDTAIKRGRISVTKARKLAVFMSSLCSAVFILAATYAECNHMLVMVFMTLLGCADAFAPAGLFSNPMDLSPNYSGTIMSIGNAAGALCGIVAPYTVTLLTPNAYLSEWRLVFWISAIIHFLKTVGFSFWGSGEVQPWNEKQRTNKLLA